MIYIVDIDGTICNTSGNDYENAEPIYKNIEKINKLYDDNVVIYWTARGTSSNKNWFIKTHEQLIDWGCKFHKLWTGKPSYDIWIDDKSKRIEEI